MTHATRRETMTTTSRSGLGRTTAMRTVLAAALGAAVLAPLAAGAQTTRDPRGEAPTRRVASNWSFDLRGTYTDNYRRLPDELDRLIVYGNDVNILGQTISVPTVARDRGVAIEPPSNVVVTAALRGGSVYERPGLTGIITGGVSVSLYTDDASVDQRLSDELGAPIPDGVLPDGVTDDAILVRTFGLDQEEEIFIRPDLSGSATLRLADDLAYLDIAGLAQQQTISARDNVAQEADGRVGDVTTFVGGSVSPYLNREIGGGGVVEARYRLSAVIVADEDFDDAALGRDPTQENASDQRFANDSVAHEALLEYGSGQLFDRFGFTVRASAARSDEQGSDVLPEVELTRLTGEGEFSYDLGRRIELTAAVGYDDVTIDEADPAAIPPIVGEETPLDDRDDAFSGVFWSAGFRATPTPRTNFSLAVGERFGGTQVTGRLAYRPTPRLNVSARAERELGTGAQTDFQNLRGLNSRTLQIVEQLAQVSAGSARQLLDRAVSFEGGFSNIQQQNFGVSVRDTFGLNASYTANRTNFSGGVSFSSSEFGGAGNERSNDRLSVQAAVNRQVTRRIDLGASARFERTEGVLPIEVVLDRDGATDLASDQLFLSLDGAYRVGPRLSVTARAYRVDSEGLAGAGTGREYVENAVSAGIRWTF